MKFSCTLHTPRIPSIRLIVFLFLFLLWSDLWNCAFRVVFLVLLESSLQGGMHKLCFMAIQLTAKQDIEFQSFMN